MTMTKKTLFTIVHATACGALGGSVPDHEVTDDWFGLGMDMGMESYARYIKSLRDVFGGDHWTFGVSCLEEFDSIPAAVEHIWENRETLKPWKKHESE